MSLSMITTHNNWEKKLLKRWEKKLQKGVIVLPEMAADITTFIFLYILPYVIK